MYRAVSLGCVEDISSIVLHSTANLARLSIGRPCVLFVHILRFFEFKIKFTSESVGDYLICKKVDLFRRIIVLFLFMRPR